MRQSYPGAHVSQRLAVRRLRVVFGLLLRVVALRTLSALW